jgi:hypothetical protein
MSQVIPPDNVHIAKLKKLFGKFLCMGSLYKIDRNQLCLSLTEGDLKLMNIEFQMKPLFIKITLTKNVENISDPRNDYLFGEKHSIR